MRVAITTLGCKVNSYESEATITRLVEQGFQRVSFEEESDIYIINTCMVTNTGEAKSRKMIRHPLKINPNAIIIVMGCLTQLKADEILSIEGVKIVLGTNHRDQIGEYIQEYMNNETPLNKVSPLLTDEPYDNLVIRDFKNHQRAFLKIQDGCNNFCTYCIIPYTRGRVRSKSKEQVLTEAARLVEMGHVEIILTGIHTGGYGEDIKDYSFADLLKDLEKVEGLKRIRISSIEMTELTDEIIELISKSHKIVNHLHIPLQGGSNRILKLMNRKYTIEGFIEKMHELHRRIPHLAITSDVIVGFPSETTEDFEQTVETVKTIAFSELHVFPYSKRSGTVASKMTGEVDGNTKKERVQKLIEVSDALAKAYIVSEMAYPQEVIVETSKNGRLYGHTSNYIYLSFDGSDQWIGDNIRVRITKEAYPLSEAEVE